MSKKETLICSGCGYEEVYRGTYQKPPACPRCLNLLSFKDSLDTDYEEEIPFLNKILAGAAVLLVISATVIFLNFFKTSDNRGVLAGEARVNQIFFGGKAHAKIPVEFSADNYSYERYWAGNYRGKVGKMVHEDHRYIFQGLSNGKIQVQYNYTASGGRKGSRLFLLPVVNNQAVLEIPAIPYIKRSYPHQVTLILTPANTALVQDRILERSSKA